MKSKTVVLVSGGMDSATLLWRLRSDSGTAVRALAANYGQRHVRELESAERLCHAAGVPLDIINLKGLRPLLRGSSQTDSNVPVPVGHYADEVMKLTVVPNRNMILLSVAAAAVIGWDQQDIGSGAELSVAYAAHRGDHPVYPDCRPEFIAHMEEALAKCHYKPVRLIAPFSDRTKADLVTLGQALGVPWHLTWSCYQGEQEHCGLCGTCVERREAFMLAGVTDPVPYSCKS